MPLPPHPNGIEPWGNFLLRGGPNIRDQGLGALHVLSDELLLEVLGHLAAQDLARLAACSRSLYCFANYEDLWRALVIQELEGNFTWGGTWQQTLLLSKGIKQPSPAANSAGQGGGDDNDDGRSPAKRPGKKQKTAAAAAAAGGKGKQRGKQQQTAGTLVAGSDRARCPSGLVVRGFYSDLLYQPWFCAHVDLNPEWLEVDNIDRRKGLSLAQFREEYEIPNRPVIVTDVVTKWPAMKRWSREYLLEAYGGAKVIAGNYEMDLPCYFDYADSQHDEQPLYLFDKHFSKKAPKLLQDYHVPEIFGEDLFAVLGEARPHYRWLIMGPPRSGSSFHVDPNATSAWNGVVTGSKKWILYPPHVIPPGVHPSADGADVATPISLAEWFLNFYQATKEAKVKPIECIVKAGEMIFVPRGWWHLALNLEESVAVTQNYVSSVTLPHVLKFLQSCRMDLVSGCDKEARLSLYHRFQAALKAQRPEVMQALEAQQAAARAKAQEEHRLASLFRAPAGAMAAAGGVEEEDGPAAAAPAAPTGGGGSAKGGSSRARVAKAGARAAGYGKEGGEAAGAVTGAKTEPAAAAPSSGGFSFGFQL